MEKRLPSVTVDVNVNGTTTMENSMEVTQKIKYRSTIGPSNPTPGHTS